MELTELIQAVQNSIRTEIITGNDGFEYSTRHIFPLSTPKDPSPVQLEINTLSGLLGFLRNKDWKSKEATFIHVMSPNVVVVVSGLYGPNKQRDIYCILNHRPLFGEDFSFGKYFDHETFVVALQTLFAPTLKRDELLNIIASIKTEEIYETSDNGVSQAVVARSGIATVQPVVVPSPIMLKPFRTFREIDQPESPFIVRVKKGNPLPQVALFECDGGMWKIEAMTRIVKAIVDIQEQAGEDSAKIQIIA